MAEKEYIEREAVIDFCKKIIHERWNETTAPVSWSHAYADFIDDINNQPAADVAPVKHGHWILTKRTKLILTDKIGIKESFTTSRNGTLVDESNINKKAMILKKRITVIKPKCSECGYYGYDEDDIAPYCQNCGAKMDEGEKMTLEEARKD